MKLVLLALIFAANSLFAINPDKSKPNILFILVDDMGYGDLSSHGATDMRTPNIDAMMKAGLRFDNFYANSCVCSPTRASLMTGLYPDKAGVPGVIRLKDHQSWGHLNEKVEILPSLLRRTGYRTALIGKWHLGAQSPNLPNQRGFDLFKGFRGGMVKDYYNFQANGSYASDMWHNDEPIMPEGHCTDLFSDWSVDYLEKASKTNHPFFLYLAYNAPHTPIQPPKAWEEKVRIREKGLSADKVKYIALIEHLDEGIGKVMHTLETTGLAENTLVVFSSDNGGNLSAKANNGKLRGGKLETYEGGLRVPTCVIWPGNTKPETRSSLQALTMDFFPTLCEVAGASIPHQTDGVSLVPTLQGKEQNSIRSQAYFVRREGGIKYNGLTIQALQQGDYKLLQNTPFDALEMYNLKNDPLEENNLVKKEPKRAHSMQEQLLLHIQDGGRVRWMRDSSRLR